MKNTSSQPTKNDRHPLAIVVGTNIVQKRKMRNLTQEQLADMIDVGQQSLSRMERGFIEPQFGRLQKLADVLHCHVYEFFQKPTDELEERLSTVRDIIAPLSPVAQQAAINIIAEMSRELAILEKKLKAETAFSSGRE